MMHWSCGESLLPPSIIGTSVLKARCGDLDPANVGSQNVSGNSCYTMREQGRKESVLVEVYLCIFETLAVTGVRRMSLS